MCGAGKLTQDVGKQIVRSMARQGGGKYKGKVLRPADGKIYNGKAEFSGSRMILAGCVAGGLLCKKTDLVAGEIRPLSLARDL